MGGDPVYPGARPFSRAESLHFYGRTTEAARVVSTWLRNPLTYLTGPAGIGKTSLLAAGALPTIEREQREHHRTTSLLPVGAVSAHPATAATGLARFPVAALPQHNPYLLALLKSWTPFGSSDMELASVPVYRFISDYAQKQPDRIILAAIDQADDLFAGPARRQPLRQWFLEELAAALHLQPRLRLLVSVRSDVLAQFAEVLGPGTEISLDALQIPDAHEAVAEPGFFTSDAAIKLVESMCTSQVSSAPGKQRIVITETVEPALLQVTCSGMWKTLRRHTSQATLHDLQHHEASVDAALTGYCQTVISTVAGIHGIGTDELRTWLIDTFITDVGELAEAPEDQQPQSFGPSATVARALEDRYLLRARAEGGRVYRLIGDRLIEPLRHTADQPDDASADQQVQPDPDEYLYAAERARLTGEHGLAAKLIAHVLRIAPESDLRRHAAAHTLIGDLAYEQEYFAEAENAYRMAMLLSDACSDKASVGRLLVAIAGTLISRQKHTEALECMKSAVIRLPDDTVRNVLLWMLQANTQEPPGSTAA